jgi:hypothetical protein
MAQVSTKVAATTLDALFSRLKVAHANAKQAYEVRLAGLVPQSTSSVVISPKQQAIIAHFSKWDYGCQRVEIRELVELLAELPAGTLKDTSRSRSSGSRDRPFQIKEVFNGMFVRFKKKGGWDFDITIGDPCLVREGYFVSTEIRQSSIPYTFGTKTLEELAEYVEVLPMSEIDTLFDAWKVQVNISGTVAARLVKLFELT